MAIERNVSGGVTVTGARDIELYRQLAVKHALRLETLGMTRSGGRSVLPLAKQIILGYGLKPKRTKADVLDQLTELVAKP